jgi:hypothetical protein
LAGIGWRVESDSETISWEQYCGLGHVKYSSDGPGWWAAANAMGNRMKLGDLCWTRTKAGKYWLGRIKSNWSYRAHPGNVTAGIFNVRECEWVEVGDEYEVPGVVVNSFRGRRTLQAISGEAIRLFSMFDFNTRCKRDHYCLPSGKVDLFTVLSPEDCEDLVGVYLQTKGYILFPGTCKNDTKQYEFMLKHRESHHCAGVQVKQGGVVIDPEDYKLFDGTVYLFQTGECYLGSTPSNVVLLRTDEMEKFCMENQDLLPPRIKRWIEILKQVERCSPQTE